MNYRGKDPRATVTGGGSKSTSSKSKYRGAPVAGSAGYYKGRGYERATAPKATTAATTARPARGAAGGATGTPRMAGGMGSGATNPRAMLRDQVSQLRQQQLRDQLRYLRQQGLIDV